MKLEVLTSLVLNGLLVSAWIVQEEQQKNRIRQLQESIISKQNEPVQTPTPVATLTSVDAQVTDVEGNVYTPTPVLVIERDTPAVEKRASKRASKRADVAERATPVRSRRADLAERATPVKSRRAADLADRAVATPVRSKRAANLAERAVVTPVRSKRAADLAKRAVATPVRSKRAADLAERAAATPVRSRRAADLAERAVVTPVKSKRAEATLEAREPAAATPIKSKRGTYYDEEEVEEQMAWLPMQTASADQCDPGYDTCSVLDTPGQSICVNLLTSYEHCGECNAACDGDSEECLNGICVSWA